MNKVLKNVINGAIEREYEHVSGDYKEILKKNPEASRLTNKLIEELKEFIPEDKYNLLNSLIDSVVDEVAIETRTMFKEGVIRGITGLNYLSEVGEEIQLI